MLSRQQRLPTVVLGTVFKGLISDRARARARARARLAQFQDHHSEHGGDAEQKRAGAVEQVWCGQSKDTSEIEDGCGFGTGAARDSVEASLVGGCKLASALGDVQRNRARCAPELIAEVGAALRKRRGI
jgi:hypothetical protein